MSIYKVQMNKDRTNNNNNKKKHIYIFVGINKI